MGLATLARYGDTIRAVKLGRSLAAVCAAFVAWTVSSSAAAQEEYHLDPELFLPTVAPGTGFTVERAGVLSHRTFVFGLHEGFALRPSVGDGRDVVPFRTQTEAMIGVGLFHFLELDVTAPVVVARVADDPLSDQTDPDTSIAAGLGDVRMAVKVALLRGDGPFHVATRLLVTAPTGDDGRLLGYGSWTATPSVIAGYEKGRLSLAADVGYRMRRRETFGDLEQDDELAVSVAGQYRVADPAALIAEAQARLGVAGRRMEREENPMEADLGVRFFFADSAMTLDVGGGTRLIEGYGAPVARGFATLRYVLESASCEFGPEDRDGYDDGDFCADLDNDRDGLEDTADECPNDAEDEDEFLDDDGCPDVDNDADGLLDGVDRCPLVSEDADGFEDDDGCPEPDNDEDGLRDGADRCPMEAEDVDAYQDDDGCPEPGPGAHAVVMADTRILIAERIFFEHDAFDVRPVNGPLLDEVAASFMRLPADRRLRIEGYSDDEGADAYNLDLAYRRAHSTVDQLVARGVPRERIVYVGYGERRPIAPNDSPEGRALNRRVEFTVILPGEDAGAVRTVTTPGPEPSRRHPRRGAPP